MSDERKAQAARLRDTAANYNAASGVPLPQWLRRELESAADALEATESERAAAFRAGAEAMKEMCYQRVKQIRAGGDMPMEDDIMDLPLPTMPAPAGETETRHE